MRYVLCSANSAKICRTRIISSSFWDMRHYTPAACCYATRAYEIGLYVKTLPIGSYSMTLILPQTHSEAIPPRYLEGRLFC